MTTLLAFLSENTRGFVVLVGILFFLILLIQWTAWLFNWGRFQHLQTDKDVGTLKLRYMIVEFFAGIVNDFRHLLAIALTLVFAGAIVAVFLIAHQNRYSIEIFKEGLQIVVATLGGLIGSVVGYYFGESAASRTRENQTGITSDNREEEPIIPARELPSSKNGDSQAKNDQTSDDNSR